MVFWMIVMAANLVVGAFVGLTGVAGFLLPIVYTGPLGMGVTEGLALSFAAFIVSGALGSIPSCFHQRGTFISLHIPGYINDCDRCRVLCPL